MIELTVNKQGNIECVQQDVLDLCELGHVTNERASDVVWDDKCQEWVATIRAKFLNFIELTHVFRDKSRAVCIQKETEYLNRR